MPNPIKIGIAVLAAVVVLPILGIIVLFVGIPQFTSSLSAPREIPLPNHGSLIIDGKQRDRSEHGFSQWAGYRPPGMTNIEWFGEVSDGVEPQVYQAGPLVVVIDLPGAQIHIRTHVVHAPTKEARDGSGVSLHDAAKPMVEEKWKSLALIFPNDLGPFPIFLLRGKERTDARGSLAGQRARR